MRRPTTGTCVDGGMGSCYSTLTSDLVTEGLSANLADLAGCLVAIGKAVISCKEWVRDGGATLEAACEDANDAMSEECQIEC